VRRFARWLGAQGNAVADSYEQLDRQLMEYVEHLWDTGDSRSVANYTLAAVQHFLNVRSRFVGAWSLISAWQRMELPVRTPPLPVLVLTGMAGWALQRGRLDFTACLLVGFAGFLRTGEVLTLTRDLVVFDGPQSAVLVLPHTKMSERRGGPERVPITDPTAVDYLRRRCARLRPGERIFSGSGGHFRELFRTALADLHLSNYGFQPYSLRRGGATHAYRTSQNLPHVMFVGRWAHVATARIYVQEGLVRLNEFALTLNPGVTSRLRSYSRLL